MLFRSQVGNDVLYGDAGEDFILGNEGDDTLSGGDGNDELQGGVGEDVLVGGQGDDKLFGEGDNDMLYGGLGIDELYGEGGDDALYGGEGADILFGGEGNDTADGGIGNDYIVGEEGDDVLSGDEGDDEVVGGAGNDTLSGGSGNDILAGGEGDDKLAGESGNDILYGGGGNDTLTSADGSDYLSGGEGNDTYIIGSGVGRTSIRDTGGSDVLVFEGGATPTGYRTYDFSNNVTFIFANGGEVTFDRHEIESVKFADGTMRSVQGWEGSSGEVYMGSSVEDSDIAGSEGNDALTSYLGSDVLLGHGGDDLIFSGQGNDVVSGGAGNDVVDGGYGSDTYLFNAGDGSDQIYSFDYGFVNSFDVGVGTGSVGYFDYFPNEFLSAREGSNEDDDTLVLGESIHAEDVTFSRQGDNLALSINGTTDQVTVMDWFAGEAYQLDQIVFDSGRVLSPDRVQQVIDLGGVIPVNQEIGRASGRERVLRLV